MRDTRWIVLAIVIVASSIAYILRSNISIVSETMMHDLGMNEYQLGMVFAAFSAGYAIFQFPGGIVGDKFGPRRTLTIAAIAWALLTIVTAFIPGTDVLSVGAIVAALMVTRFMFGVVQAPFFPVAIGGTIANWFPVRQWGLPNGLSSTGLTLGAAATAPLVVWLMESYGWRGAMLITAPTALIVAAAYHWFVTDDPGDHPRISAAELALIKSDRPPPQSEPEKGVWKLALKDKNILLITISNFCMNYVFFLFFHWFFFYLVDVKGFAATDAGMLTATLWILGAIGSTAGGIACDVLVHRLGIRQATRYMIMPALVLAAVLLCVGAVSDNIVVVMVSLCLCFGLTQLTEAPYWVAVMTVAGPHAPMATGILNTGGNLPGIVGGLLVPVLAGLFGWPAAMMSGGVFAIIGALLWLFIRADEPMCEPRLLEVAQS